MTTSGETILEEIVADVREALKHEPVCEFPDFVAAVILLEALASRIGRRV